MDLSFKDGARTARNAGKSTQSVSPVQTDGTLSQKLWNIEWSKYFPKMLSDTVLSQPTSFDVLTTFMSDNFSDIYELQAKDERFLLYDSSEARKKFYLSSVDIFGFFEGETVVGVFTGNPIDWSTYYIRNCSILPQYQQRKLLQSFLPYFLNCLKETGVQRVETDIAPSNLVNIHVLNKGSFNITGLTLSERWGSLLRFTKFLHRDPQDVFLKQFCAGVNYQAKPK